MSCLASSRHQSMDTHLRTLGMCDMLVNIRGAEFRARCQSSWRSSSKLIGRATSEKALATLDGVLCADAGLVAARALVGCAGARRAMLHLYALGMATTFVVLAI